MVRIAVKNPRRQAVGWNFEDQRSFPLITSAFCITLVMLRPTVLDTSSRADDADYPAQQTSRR